MKINSRRERLQTKVKTESIHFLDEIKNVFGDIQEEANRLLGGDHEKDILDIIMTLDPEPVRNFYLMGFLRPEFNASAKKLYLPKSRLAHEEFET
ncbi:MAG: hypothetical protein ACP5QG_02690 [candidate division WOR-3 bacterium]